MNDDKQKTINKVFTFVMAVVLVFIVAVFSAALYKHCTHSVEAPQYNIDSLRQIHYELQNKTAE